MKHVKALVIRTAGTNCDKETSYACSIAGMDVDLYHINYLRSRDLSSYQIICIPGGFSYGDDLGAGKIFSLELSLWFRDAIHKHIDKGGLIIGICNGFQVLVRLGILPFLDFTPGVTLLENDSQRFEDRWVYLKVEENSKAKDIWFKGLSSIIHLPVAHGEGKFYAEDNVLDEIENEGMVALRYVRPDGKIDGYPYNPNGSLRAIAGITDRSGRILGLMPHPERCIFSHHHPLWRRPDEKSKSLPWGLKIFENAREYFR